MKKILAAALCAVMVLGVVGCSSSTDTSEATTEVSTEASTDAATEESAEIVVSDDDFYAVSLGWMENASGQRQKAAFEAKFEEYGITNYEIVDANYDASVQSQQIEAFIAQSPAALFITASDPIGISSAVEAAADAGIPVFSSDALIPGAEVASTVMFDNYSGGYETMKILADTLLEEYPEGDIVIGMITLPSNDAWDMREHGADALLASDEKYDRIVVEYEWPWDSTGAVTPTSTISSWIAADTDKELVGIWCAWDGAAFEGLVVTAEARPEILYTGSDGGEQCFETMVAYPDQFIATLGESVWAMPNQLVDYAMTYLNGGTVPRLVMVEGYLITSDMIVDAYSVADEEVTVSGTTTTVWDAVINYDLTGYTSALNEVLEANGLDTFWIPAV